MLDVFHLERFAIPSLFLPGAIVGTGLFNVGGLGGIMNGKTAVVVWMFRFKRFAGMLCYRRVVTPWRTQRSRVDEV
jgi:hypothetical protein